MLGLALCDSLVCSTIKPCPSFLCARCLRSVSCFCCCCFHLPLSALHISEMQAKLATSVFSQPAIVYISADQANRVISRSRSIAASSDLLLTLNSFCDEFLFLVISACTTNATDIPATPAAAVGNNSTLDLPFTTETFKTLGLLRVLPNTVGKACVYVP